MSGRSASTPARSPAFAATRPTFAPADWHVAPAPADLNDRRVEITGPTERKMMINALNSGAKVFMADFEDALSPTWENVIQGQINCSDAIAAHHLLPQPGRPDYQLNETVATLLVRPRGWHLVEKHVLVDGAADLRQPLRLRAVHVPQRQGPAEARAAAPISTCPSSRATEEARLWNDVFNYAQDELGIARGTIRATVLIETILGALEMEEILYELREHSAGLNAGRWDYIFSAIKKFAKRQDLMLPDRAQVTMTVPFMRAYTELLVHTCHKRGAHAIGGMAAFIPNRRDPAVTENALAKVREDKLREFSDGCDGTWVAHPDLVPTVLEIADAALGDKPNQKERLREDVHVLDKQITAVGVPGGKITGGRPAAEHQRCAAVPQRLAGRQRRGGHQQPDGRCRHRRNLALADLAVDPPRRQAGRRSARHPQPLPAHPR